MCHHNWSTDDVLVQQNSVLPSVPNHHYGHQGYWCCSRLQLHLDSENGNSENTTAPCRKFWQPRMPHSLETAEHHTGILREPPSSILHADEQMEQNVLNLSSLSTEIHMHFWCWSAWSQLWSRSCHSVIHSFQSYNGWALKKTNTQLRNLGKDFGDGWICNWCRVTTVLYLCLKKAFDIGRKW